MAYRRRGGYRRRRRGGYRKRGSRGTSGVAMAMKALSLARYVKSLVNVEVKSADSLTQNIANTVFTSAGSMIYLSGIAQGADYFNRIGDSIKAKSLVYKMSVQVGNTNTNIRVILFIDTECNNAAPSGSDLLQNVDVRSHLNHFNGKRFRILNDWFYNLNTVNNVNKIFKTYHKLNQHIKFDGTGSTVAAAREGSMFLYVLSETASGAASPVAYYDFKLNFVDN